MTKASADRMTLFVAALGLMATLTCFFVSGGVAAYSAGVGAGMALANFLLLRMIVVRVVEGDLHRKAPFIGLLFFKMGGLMFLVYWVIAQHWVEPIAFTVGMSSLAVGLIVSSFFALGAPGPRRSNELANESGSKSGNEY